jgi:hypothetical protein
MPRRIVMSTIVTRCKQQCDQENANHILGPEWKARISERYGELWSIVNGTGLRYFETSTTVTATGAASYDEPAAIESTVLITRVLGDGRELELAPLEPQEEACLKGRTGDACRFSLIDDQLRLYPKPSSGTYNWYYRPQPPDLATFADSDPVDVCCMAGPLVPDLGRRGRCTAEVGVGELVPGQAGGQVRPAAARLGDQPPGDRAAAPGREARQRPCGVAPVKAPLSIKLTDDDAEQVRRSHHDAIAELQKQPAVALKAIAGVELPDGVTVQVAHGLGRAPVFVRESIPRGAVTAGLLVEVRTGVDRTKYVALVATGWGATITVDLEVF